MVKNDKESACNAGDLGSVPGLGGRHGNPVQYSCLENPMNRGAWQATVHGVAKSQTQLIDFTSVHFTLDQHLSPLVADLKTIA